MSYDPLRDEHESLQRAVLASRRTFAASPASAFVREMDQAIDGYLEMREQSVSRDDACKGLEHVLRAAWPKKVSKFSAACDRCDDTGWQLRWCADRLQCARKSCAEHPEREHAYVEACTCPAGDKFRPRVYQPDDEYAEIGKTRKPKPKGWSRAGR